MNLSQLNPKARRVVREVIRKILASHPEDAERLVKNVREIRPLTAKEKSDGTRGEWVRDPEDAEKFWSGECSFIPGEDWPGIVLIDDRSSNLKGILAHEFGHACTTCDDLSSEKFAGPQDEWQSEIIANWYACRWGFRRPIERMMETADLLHHGPSAGMIGEEFGVEFRIADNYEVEIIQRHRRS